MCIRRSVCAYSNDLPGYGSSGVVFVGAADDGSPASLPIIDALLLALSDMRGQGKLLPPPIMHVRKLVAGSAEVAVIEVEPSPSPPDLLQANGRNQIERLATLRLATLDGTPTVAGMLILGIDPTRRLPGAYVQFLRVDGLDLAAPIIDEKRLDQALPSLLRKLDELLKLNIRTHVERCGA